MNILILGGGGREHMMAMKLAESERCSQLFVAPGNAGTDQVAQNVPVAADDFPAIARFVSENNIELIVVGPEDPLVKGIRDFFEADEVLKKVAIVGPGKAGAMLEGSKDFSKAFMQKYGIPTAGSRTFTADSIDEGLSYLESSAVPVVLKADGLAAGKGVIIAESIPEAQDTLKQMLLDKQFGEASAKVLIEEYMQGIELSVFVLTDGDSYVVLPEAKDYKRIGEGDAGLNTGGMGAVSPVSFANSTFMKKVEDQVIAPTIKGLKQEGIDYKGFIFIGLMNVDGEPKVIEYNVRMGDPETQAVFPRIKTDMVELLLAAATGRLHDVQIETDEQTAATVVLVAGGYPGSYQKGDVISGLSDITEALVIHAGTKHEGYQLLTNGGRVMAVTGMGETLEDALEKAYDAAARISWNDMYYRKDIGKDILALQID